MIRILDEDAAAHATQESAQGDFAKEILTSKKRETAFEKYENEEP